MNRLLDNTLTELSGVSDDDAMRRVVASHLGSNGFAGFLFNVYAESATRMMCSCGQDLMLRYRKDDYHLVDPVSRQARSSWLPVPWDARDYLARCTGKSARLFELAIEYGYERGISVPIHGPSGGLDMLVGLSRHSEGEFNRDKHHWNSELMVIGLHMSSVYHGVLHPDQSATAELTQRELECLHWTAQGKTAWEVSRVLDVSERTVLFHIRNACAKLNASYKHLAARKAVSMGLIRH